MLIQGLNTVWYLIVFYFTPSRPRIRRYKMTISIDYIVKDSIQMGPVFISAESVKHIASVPQKMNKIGQKKVPACPTENRLISLKPKLVFLVL